MNLDVISSKKAPAAIGPYSQAILAGRLLFCSGQIAIDPATGEMVSDDIVTQTVQVLENIAGLLEAAQATLEDVAKTTIFLTDMDNFAAVNEVYGRYFGDHKPARSTVAVRSLPKGALIEIEVVAAL